MSSAEEIIPSVTVGLLPHPVLSNAPTRCTSPAKVIVSYADGRSFLSYQQGSLAVPGQPSPPALSISSRSERVSALYNTRRLLVTVLNQIFCTYEP